jgi:hypothetical protein
MKNAPTERCELGRRQSRYIARLVEREFAVGGLHLRVPKDWGLYISV